MCAIDIPAAVWSRSNGREAEVNSSEDLNVKFAKSDCMNRASVCCTLYSVAESAKNKSSVNDTLTPNMKLVAGSWNVSSLLSVAVSQHTKDGVMYASQHVVAWQILLVGMDETDTLQSTMNRSSSILRKRRSKIFLSRLSCISLAL